MSIAVGLGIATLIVAGCGSSSPDDPGRARAYAREALSAGCRAAKTADCHVTRTVRIARGLWRVRYTTADGHGCLDIDVARFGTSVAADGTGARFEGVAWIDC